MSMIAISTYPLNRINLMRMAERLRFITMPIGMEFFYDELPSDHAYYYQFRMEELLETKRVSMHCPVAGCDPLADEGSPLWQFTVTQHQRCFELAEQLGIRHLVYHPNSLTPFPPEALPQKQVRLQERLAFFSELAAAHQITLCVENVGHAAAGNLVLDEAAFCTLMQAHPTLQVSLDVGHAHLNQWQIPLVIAALGSQISGYHLHDNHADADQHLPIGCGTVAWGALWHSIATFTPHADLILEYAKNTAEEQMIQDCCHLPSRLCFEQQR